METCKGKTLIILQLAKADKSGENGKSLTTEGYYSPALFPLEILETS